VDYRLVPAVGLGEDAEVLRGCRGAHAKQQDVAVASLARRLFV
jgi:hypothetical protein